MPFKKNATLGKHGKRAATNAAVTKTETSVGL